MAQRLARGGTEISQRWHRDWPEMAQRLARGGTEIGQRWHRDWPEVAQRLARGGTEIGQRWHRSLTSSGTLDLECVFCFVCICREVEHFLLSS